MAVLAYSAYSKIAKSSPPLITNKHPCVPPTLGRTSTLQSTSTPMEYLQRTPTLQVTHIPHSVLFRVGSTRYKKGVYFSRAKRLAQEVLYGLCVILCAKRSSPNYTQEFLLHKVPPIQLNKPLSTILWRVWCTHSVWRFTQVYDIVNKSVYQVYSKFRIQNSEFSIQNSEFGIQNSEFGIQNSEL